MGNTLRKSIEMHSANILCAPKAATGRATNDRVLIDERFEWHRFYIRSVRTQNVEVLGNNNTFTKLNSREECKLSA
jgi:hypothetical protein